QSGLYVSVGESLIHHVGIHFELGGTRGQLAFAIRGVPSAVVAEDPASGQGVPGLGGSKERVVRPADFGIETALTRRSRTATVGRARVATARTARAARAIAGVAPNADARDGSTSSLLAAVFRTQTAAVFIAGTLQVAEALDRIAIRGCGAAARGQTVERLALAILVAGFRTQAADAGEIAGTAFFTALQKVGF